MEDSGRHVCMLPQEPKYDFPPNAGLCRRLRWKMRELQLPCKWHHATKLYIRSQKSLKMERDRQVNHSRWYIWHPYSPIKYFWDFFMMLFNYVALIYLALEVFRPCPEPFSPWTILVDVFGFVDICTKFITGIDIDDDGSKIILEPKQIAPHYLRSTFMFDLISVIPFQCIKFFEHCQYPTHTAWYLLKLLRLFSMQTQWRNWYNQVKFSYVTSNTITLGLQLIMFFHWMTFTYYQIPLYCINMFQFDQNSTSWLAHIHRLQSKPPLEKYSSCLFYVCGLIVGAGYYRHVEEYLAMELVMNAVLGLFGLMFLLYTFTTLLRVAIYYSYEIFFFTGRMKELQDYMVFKQMPSFLQRKIQLFLTYKFYEQYYNEQAILNTINEQIKQDINMFYCKRLVLNVPLFQDLPVALINAIVFSLQQQFYMPGEVIVKCNQPGNFLYVIYSGTVTVSDANGRETAHLRDGAHWGVGALLAAAAPSAATVLALEVTEIFKLGYKEYQSCLQPYPHLKRRLEDRQNTDSRTY